MTSTSSPREETSSFTAAGSKRVVQFTTPPFSTSTSCCCCRRKLGRVEEKADHFFYGGARKGVLPPPPNDQEKFDNNLLHIIQKLRSCQIVVNETVTTWKPHARSLWIFSSRRHSRRKWKRRRELITPRRPKTKAIVFLLSISSYGQMRWWGTHPGRTFWSLRTFARWRCWLKVFQKSGYSDGLQLSLVKLYLNYLFFVHGYFPAVETRHVQFSWEVLMQLLLTCFQQHALASCGAQDFSIYCRPNSQSLTTHGSQRRSSDVCEWRRFFFFFFGSFWSGCACCFSLKEKEIKIFDETQNEWVAAALDDVILLSPK